MWRRQPSRGFRRILPAGARSFINHASTQAFAAQKHARADELVYFRGHITAEPEDGVYVFEDGTGNVRVEIPNEARTGVTLRRDVRYEVFGRALRLPFEELRVQAETLTPISGK